MACPAGAITSFPLQLGITATDMLYDTVSEPITMDFQWATRSTPPIFTDKVKCITDEVGGGNTNLTTLRFMNNNYTVASVQIIAASHTAWILPNTAQVNNTEDIVITFSTTSTTTQYSYITFVIPILRGSSGTSSYLNGLSNPSAQGPFSLQDCFPTSRQARFSYYATCLAGYSGSANSQNSYVFVSTDGLQVTSTLMATILTVTGRPNTFGTYSPPFLSRLTSTPTTISNIPSFTKYVMTTRELLNYTAFRQLYPAIETGIRQDDTSAYKCVPIDPDTAILDGKIHVDFKSGEVLTEVLNARDAVREAHGTNAGIDPGRIEKYLGSAIGILLSIILFGSILWFTILMFFKGTAGPNTDPLVTGTIKSLDPEIIDEIKGGSWLSKIPGYLLMVLIAGFIGFIVGAMLN